jgi:glycosyltransferase involved in cell wall biosynthesis
MFFLDHLMGLALSVITPIYNCEAFLRRSLDSLFAQGYDDFEVIIINDGSTDGCVDIVKSYNDDRIRFIDHKDNKRIPTRRNEAIAEAKGDLIAIHDGDDISLPWRFQLQVSYMHDHPDIFCVGGHAIKINEAEDIIGLMNYPPSEHKDIEYAFSFRCMNPIIDPTTMFRRDIFNRLGGYSLEKAIYTVPDFDLWTRAILEGQVFSNFPDPMILYRCNDAGMTQSHQDQMIREHMIVWRRFMRRYHIMRRSKLFEQPEEEKTDV